jgi:hypothetical protein
MPSRSEPPGQDVVSDLSPGDGGTESETSPLLGSDLTNCPQENIGTVYGTVEAIPEEHYPNERAESKRFSNAFITRTVLALCIGKLTQLFWCLGYQLITMLQHTGAFTANADGSLVLATQPIIGSEFNNLESSNWLIIEFLLAGLSTQALVSLACLQAKVELALIPI